MKKIGFTILGALLSLSVLSSPVRAEVNINLLNVNSPDTARLQQTYANTYGFPTTAVAPVMTAPATEVPTILQIAKSASLAPVAIWGLRRMGFSYMDILKMYTLPPSVLFTPNVPYERLGPTLQPVVAYQQQYGPVWPQTVALADPAIIQLGQIHFFTVGLRIPGISLLTLPTDPFVFNQVILNPWGHPTYFIPPGQAMKMGLWLPPGQAKKVGLWEPPGQAKKHWGHEDWDDDDHGHHHDHDHGKWEAKGGGGGWKGKGKFKD